jgi:hypothetical protein
MECGGKASAFESGSLAAKSPELESGGLEGCLKPVLRGAAAFAAALSFYLVFPGLRPGLN